jgi:hypothetical protein
MALQSVLPASSAPGAPLLAEHPAATPRDHIGWGGTVQRRAEEVRERLAAVDEHGDADNAWLVRAANVQLDVAVELAHTPCRRWKMLFLWLTLQTQESDELCCEASRSLAKADAATLRVEPHPAAMRRVEEIRAELDELRVPTKVRQAEGKVLDDFLEPKSKSHGTDDRRDVSRAVLHLGEEAAVTQKHWADFNARLFGVSMWLLIGLLAIGAVTAIWPWFLPLCPDSKASGPLIWCGTDNAPLRGGVLEVAVVGALAGLVSTVMALSRHPSTSVPDFVRATESGLRIPLGALVAILGVLLLQSGVAKGAVTQFQPQDHTVGVLTWAAFFGFASILFAKLVDRRLTSMADELDNPQRKSAPTKTAPAQPGS